MLAMLLILFSQDIFVGAGGSMGPSLTDTRKGVGVNMSAQVYTVPRKSIGFFYDFDVTGRSLSLAKPFRADKREYIHAVGGVFRFSDAQIQPWIGGGIGWYREQIDVWLADQKIINTIQGRVAPIAMAGTKMRVRKILFLEPKALFLVTQRPMWKFSFGMSAKF